MYLDLFDATSIQLSKTTVLFKQILKKKKMSEQLANWRDKHLNSVSCSFCAAKWYNASLHLGHGFTNSCHLPLHTRLT